MDLIRVRSWSRVLTQLLCMHSVCKGQTWGQAVIGNELTLMFNEDIFL